MGTIADAVECYAELAFNQNKLAQIAAPVGGIVQAVEVDLGSKVEEKQCVANIWSAAIAEAVAKAVLLVAVTPSLLGVSRPVVSRPATTSVPTI